MFVNVHAFLRNLRHGQRLLQPVSGRPFHHPLVGVHDNEGRGQHREHHAGQYGVEPICRNQLVLTLQRQQHKTELTRLRQIQTCAQRYAFTGATQARKACNQHKFKNNWHCDQEQHKGPSIPNNAPIKHHADGDEEQAKQNIVKRFDVQFDAVLEFRFRN